MSRVRAAEAVLACSGAATIFVGVLATGILFMLALVPLAIGLVQARTGIRIAVRNAHEGWTPYIAAGIGLLVGVLHLPGATFNPGMGDSRDVWRLAAGLILIGANAAAIWVFARPRTNSAPVSQNPPAR